MKRTLYLLVGSLWLLTMICWGCSTRPTDFKEADVKELIEKFGPVLYMHPDEKYRLANPEDILDHQRPWGRK